MAKHTIQKFGVNKVQELSINYLELISYIFKYIPMENVLNCNNISKYYCS